MRRKRSKREKKSEIGREKNIRSNVVVSFTRQLSDIVRWKTILFATRLDDSLKSYNAISISILLSVSLSFLNVSLNSRSSLSYSPSLRRVNSQRARARKENTCVDSFAFYENPGAVTFQALLNASYPTRP